MKDQSSDGEVAEPKDEDQCKKRDETLQDVLQMSIIPSKVQVILENWIKRNPDAGSHVLYGNSRISALMILCLKENYEPLLKMCQCGPREHVVIVPIARKLVKPFFELDMMEMREKFGFAFEVLNSPLTGLSISKTLLKVTCDKQNIEDVRILLYSKAKDLGTKEKKSTVRYVTIQVWLSSGDRSKDELQSSA